MEKKIIIALEIIFVIVCCTYYTIKEVIPEYKEKYGSSDHFINTNQYKSLVKVNIDNKVVFAYAINKEEKVYHLFFLNENASCLYNQKIENNTILDSFKKSIPILIENNYLKSNSTIELTYYNGKRNDIKNELQIILDIYQITPNYNEKEDVLLSLIEEYNIQGESDSEILYSLDFYSKELARDNISKEGKIEEKNYKKYSNEVYKKIENYMFEQNIENQTVEESTFSIENIPADKQGFIYPTRNSWYYIRDKKVYAFIEFDEASYCYKGSIDDVEEGEC